MRASVLDGGVAEASAIVVNRSRRNVGNSLRPNSRSNYLNTARGVADVIVEKRQPPLLYVKEVRLPTQRYPQPSLRPPIALSLNTNHCKSESLVVKP